MNNMYVWHLFIIISADIVWWVGGWVGAVFTCKTTKTSMVKSTRWFIRQIEQIASVIRDALSISTKTIFQFNPQENVSHEERWYFQRIGSPSLKINWWRVPIEDIHKSKRFPFPRRGKSIWFFFTKYFKCRLSNGSRS